ncbi:phenylalanyl-tRNA synthetase subunit beta [uncultured Tateyamaria sp.]|uniref:phenylalanyl-tRNA synthetase subunit beta n=1 Tax=uncultured Tateyamaria sp. TaxID=455651 RepID=UPI0026393B7A|nr:phenylalanyl-tRNA synthetase subunit beta [uncultured Tateyamaria sp.]
MKTYLVAGIVVLIVIAHIFLWRSDMAPGLKLTFTLINTVAWTIILAPIFLIDRWLDAIKRRNDKKPR